MGVGGAGMSGLARVLQGYGRTVSGCDRSATAVEQLRAEGIDARVVTIRRICTARWR